MGMRSSARSLLRRSPRRLPLSLVVRPALGRPTVNAALCLFPLGLRAFELSFSLRSERDGVREDLSTPLAPLLARKTRQERIERDERNEDESRAGARPVRPTRPLSTPQRALSFRFVFRWPFDDLRHSVGTAALSHPCTSYTLKLHQGLPHDLA